jgi:hypothetical protein
LDYCLGFSFVTFVSSLLAFFFSHLFYFNGGHVQLEDILFCKYYPFSYSVVFLPFVFLSILVLLLHLPSTRIRLNSTKRMATIPNEDHSLFSPSSFVSATPAHERKWMTLFLRAAPLLPVLAARTMIFLFTSVLPFGVFSFLFLFRSVLMDYGVQGCLAGGHASTIELQPSSLGQHSTGVCVHGNPKVRVGK